MLAIIRELGISINAPLKEKLNAMAPLYEKYNVHWLCEAMQVDRGTFYNHIFRNKKDNTWYAKRREILREEILKIYEENRQIFGAGKITAILKQKGYRTSEETVSFLMHDMGLRNRAVVCAPVIHYVVSRPERALARHSRREPCARPSVVGTFPQFVRHFIGKFNRPALDYLQYRS